MFEKLKFSIIILIAMLVLVILLPYQNISNYIKYAFYTKNDLRIDISVQNPFVTGLSADSSNTLILKVSVRNMQGQPVAKAHFSTTIDEKLGEITPSDAWTSDTGECIISYSPPDFSSLKATQSEVNIISTLYNSNINSSVTIKLVRPPILLMNGYNATFEDCYSLRDFLASKGAEAQPLKYNSKDGVILSSNVLESFLNEQKKQYLLKGIQVQKFDIVAHSLGGLVVRYYTSSENYFKSNDIRKIIYLSTPHRGSPWAPLALDLYKDQGIKDLIPDGSLFTNVFPSMVNKGINSSIQVGSITVENDEVVTPESASLEEWGIKTEKFNVGESNFSVDGLFSGSIFEQSNHKKILNNNKVFEKVFEMLTNTLPYPKIKK